MKGAVPSTSAAHGVSSPSERARPKSVTRSCRGHVEQEIGRLEVAMGDPSLVSVFFCCRSHVSIAQRTASPTSTTRRPAIVASLGPRTRSITMKTRPPAGSDRVLAGRIPRGRWPRRGRLRRDLVVNPAQGLADRPTPLAEPGQVGGIRRTIAPPASRPVLLADQIQGQRFQCAQLGEPGEVSCERERLLDVRGPPAELQVDADQLDEQAGPLGSTSGGGPSSTSPIATSPRGRQTRSKWRTRASKSASVVVIVEPPREPLADQGEGAPDRPLRPAGVPRDLFE